MTDHDAEIPERVQERPEELLLGGADATAEQDQQVDVRMETQMAPAVTAEREHDDFVRLPAGVGEQLPQHGVDTIGVAFERRPSARPAQHVGLELRPRGFESRDERRATRFRLRDCHSVIVSRSGLKHTRKWT